MPSLNRMLVDLKKLDYFSDPNSVLTNLRNTLEECSQKYQREQKIRIRKHSISKRDSKGSLNDKHSPRMSDFMSMRQHEDKGPSVSMHVQRTFNASQLVQNKTPDLITRP